MATLRREVALPAAPAAAWAAGADAGWVHTRPAREFVTDTQLEEAGAVCRVIFANGTVTRVVAPRWWCSAAPAYQWCQ